MQNIKSLQDKWKPRQKTGKTLFNRTKAVGESWTELRADKWGSTYTCKETWVK